MLSLLIPVLLLAALAVGLVMAIRSLVRLIRWYREHRPPVWKFLPALAMPLLIAALAVGAMALQIPGQIPAPETALETASGTVDRYIVDSYKPGRYSARRYYVSGFYLAGTDLPYRLNGRSFSTQTFPWMVAGQTVSVRYAPGRDGRQVYALAVGEEVLFDTSDAVRNRWELVGSRGLLTLLLLVYGLWVAFNAAPLICDPNQDPGKGRASKQVRARMWLICLLLIAIITLLGSRPGGTVYPAYTQVPLSLDLALQLPGQWEEESDGEYIWYSNREDVSLCVHYYDLGAPGELGMEEADWLLDYFASIRQFLLETFVDDSAMASFLSQRTTTLLPCGLEAVWAQGQAHSQGGSLNYFVTAALPEQGCAIMLQASSWDMGWEALANYGETNILPLLRCLVTDGSAG